MMREGACELWTAVVVCCAAWLGGSSAAAAISAGPVVSMPFMVEHYYVSAAVLDDGSFALAGTTVVADSSPQGSHPQFEVEFFSATGRALPDRLVPQPVGDEGGIGSLGDHYFVSWRRTLAERSFADLVGGDGVPLASASPWLNSQADFYQQFYRYGAGPAHAFLPVTFRSEGATLFGDAIETPMVIAYNASARPLGHAAGLASGLLDDAGIDGGGRIITVESRCPGSATSWEQCARGIQIFRPFGGLETSWLTDGVPAWLDARGNATSHAEVAAAQDGSFLVVWAAGVFTDTPSILARLFQVDGAPASEVMQVAQRSPSNLGGYGGLMTLGLQDGHFALSWVASTSANATEISVVELSETRVSPTLTVAASSAGTYVLSLNPTGHGILAWISVDPQTGALSGSAEAITAD
jgi:hypothetical protein